MRAALRGLRAIPSYLGFRETGSRSAAVQQSVDSADRLRRRGRYASRPWECNRTPLTVAPPSPLTLTCGVRATASTPLGDPATRCAEDRKRLAETRPFCAELWACAADVYAEITHHQFIQELQTGTLSFASFYRYQVQDTLYLRSFARVLNKAAGKAPQPHWSRLLQQRARRAMEYEQGIREDLPAGHGLPQNPGARHEPSAACSEYVSFLQSAATFRSFAETVAAVLPCYWFYAELGISLLAAGSHRGEYQQWINTFAAPDYSESVRAMLSVMEEVAQRLEPSQQEGLKRIFRTAAEMELLFWQSAYDGSLERRPV